jgi:large subunit ribosomal protein L3
MQVWPRVRAKRIYPRISRFTGPAAKEAKLRGFAGYKAGMTHIIITDAKKTSMTKGEDVRLPVTIVECPPIRIAGVRFYKHQYTGIQPAFDIIAKADKELGRKIDAPKKESKRKIADVKPEEFDQLKIIVQTQPKMTGIGKKKPEIFEVCVGGKKEEQLAFAKEHLGKEVSVKEVFAPGELVDIHAVTTGKGFQGPVKRFGVRVRHHKSEKTKRGPGVIAGGWSAQGQTMFRVAHAGQMGYHNRVDYNKQIFMISDDPKQVNVSGGYINYGNVKTTYLILKGSIIGPKKRIVRLEKALRPNKKTEQVAPTVQYISIASKQGN